MGLSIGAPHALSTVGRQAVWQTRGGYEAHDRGACSQVHAPQVANSSRRAARIQLKLWVAA